MRRSNLCEAVILAGALLASCAPARMLADAHNYEDAQKTSRRQLEVSSKAVSMRADGGLHPSGASWQWRKFGVTPLPSLDSAPDYADLGKIPGLSRCKEFYLADVEAEDGRFRYYFCHDLKEPSLIKGYMENEIGAWEAFHCPACP